MNHPLSRQSERTILSRDRAKRTSRSAAIGGGPEILEDRKLLSTDVWNGGSANWNDAANWSGKSVPISGDNVVFGGAGSVHTTALPSGFTPGSITVQSSFTLNGTLNVPTNLPVTVIPGANLTLDGVNLVGTGTVSKLGGGGLAIGTAAAPEMGGLTILGNQGPITLGGTGTLPITIKVTPGSTLTVGPDLKGGPVNVSGVTITGADNGTAGTIEVTSGSTLSPAVVNNGFFTLDPGSTFTPGKVNGGYFTQLAGDPLSSGQTLNGNFTLKSGAVMVISSSDYGSTFSDGLSPAQSTPNDFTLNVAPAAGATATFGSLVGGGGRFETSGPGTVNLAHGVSSGTGALESASLNQTGDTVFGAAITHLVTPIDIPNSAHLNVTLAAVLGLGDSSLTLDKGSVSLSQGSKLVLKIDGTAAGTQYGQLIAGGQIDLNNATLAINPGFLPTAGTVFTIVKATGTSPITGQFAGLGQGATVTQNGQSFQINYSAQAVTLTSLAGATTTSISGPSVTLKPNVPITLSAVVASPAGSPTGLITFLDGSTPVGTGILSGGVATIITSALAGGNHSISAAYSGDSSFAQSTSTVLPIKVRPASTILTVSDSAPATFSGDSTTFVATATTALGSPTGQLTFLDGPNTLGVATIDATGHAQLTTSSLAVGTHPITVSYAGDATSTAATSQPLSFPVVSIPTSTSVSSTPDHTAFGQSATLGATVLAGRASSFGMPTGSVSFLSGSTLLGAATVDASGHASLAIKSLPVGKDPIIAVYQGDSHFAPVASTASIQTVVQATTSTSLNVSPNPPVLGRPMLFTATVNSTGGMPTGSVVFKNGGKELGRISLVGGQAYLVTTLTFAPGQSITASYIGSTNFSGSGSSSLSITPETTPAVAQPTPTPPTTVPGTPPPVTTPPKVTVPLPTPIVVTPIPSQPGHPIFGHKPMKHGHAPKPVVHPVRHGVHHGKAPRHKGY